MVRRRTSMIGGFLSGASKRLNLVFLVQRPFPESCFIQISKERFGPSRLVQILMPIPRVADGAQLAIEAGELDFIVLAAVRPRGAVGSGSCKEANEKG